MLILGIDTSFCETSVAVIGRNDAILYETRKTPSPSHSSVLLSLIEEAIDTVNSSLSSFDFIAVTRGPGSFTGLRIGLATATGLADATGVPIVGVDSLDAIVEADGERGRWPFLCPVVNARKGEVYAAIFKQIDGAYKKVGDDMALSPSDLAGMIEGPTLFTGDGFLPYKDIFEEKIPFAIDHNPLPSRPVAVGAALIACRLGRDNLAEENVRPTPKYVRRPQAEINWEKLHTK